MWQLMDLLFTGIAKVAICSVMTLLYFQIQHSVVAPPSGAEVRLTAMRSYNSSPIRRHKKLSCRRETARRAMSVEILSAVHSCEKSHMKRLAILA